MRGRTGFIALAAAVALALGVYAWHRAGEERRRGPDSGAAALEADIAEIEAGRRTTPLIGGTTAGGDLTVTFLARSADGRAPRIVSDVTGWGEHVDGSFDFNAGTMARVGRTDWYALQASVAPRARIEYLVAYGQTDYRLDPHNPRQSVGPQVGGARASEFVTPGYLPPREFADPPPAPAGRTVESTMESRLLHASFRLIVYTPSGYRAGGQYPVAVFLDLRSGPASRVLDWLIARQAIEPIVAVFVGPAARGGDHITSAPLRTFLDTELMAWLEARYAVASDPTRRAVLGISFGAKDALDAALGDGAAAGAFGRLGLLIPGRRIGRADLDAVSGRRLRRLRVAILAGQYDRANLATARGLRQALADAGHAVDYTEVPEGHSAVTWINHLRTVLVSLFGPAPAPVASRR
jgi:enterochelin esterase family protein